MQYYLTLKILMRKLVATVYSEEVGQWIDSGLDQAVPQYNISLPQREFVLSDVKWKRFTFFWKWAISIFSLEN